ncbi:MAG: hypothetical protein OEV59_05910 [Deltaproteobacteria bacterium]|nr:hypothetical protein [Deltaproteobacteria bacterium]
METREMTVDTNEKKGNGRLLLVVYVVAVLIVAYFMDNAVSALDFIAKR